MKWLRSQPIFAISANSILIQPLSVLFSSVLIILNLSICSGNPFKNTSLASHSIYPIFDSKVRVESEVFSPDADFIGEDDFPIHYSSYVAKAVETGVKDASLLFETIEPALYKNSK